MRAGLSGRECVRARRRGPPLANSIQPKAPAVSDITTSGFEVTLELTFSYIVSLSVSENVSGVAIFASKLAAREKNRVRWIVRVF